MPLTPDSDFGPYHIIGPLGEGGMATVYRARQDSPRREVALKVIGAHLSSSDSFQQRFRFEADVLAALEHPNILPVFATGTAEGVAYIAYRFVSGGTLKQRLGQPVQVERAVNLLRPVAAALDFAHAHGVIHRDVKPANILFTADETPIVADFGLAKLLEAGLGHEETLTETGVSMGSPAYMAPEQVEGLMLDGRVDEYALGVVAYEMLVGVVPYRADTPMAVALKQVREPLPRPSSRNAAITPALDAVLEKALAKDPSERYASCGELVTALAATAHAADSTALYRVPEPGATQTLAAGVVRPGAADAGIDVKTGALGASRGSGRGAGWRTPALIAGGALVLLLVAGGVLLATRGGSSSKAGNGPGTQAVAGAATSVPTVAGAATVPSGAAASAGAALPSASPGGAAAAPVGQRTPPTPTPSPRPAVPLPATVAVLSADSGATVRLPEARADLAAIFATLAPRYAPMPAQRFNVTLAATEQGARTQLSNAGFTTAFVSAFFGDGDHLASRTVTDGSVFLLVYLPATSDLRAELAQGASLFFINAVGHPSATDTYAFWFYRGFSLYWLARFSSKDPPYHQTAATDVTAKTAPTLATLQTTASSTAWERTQTAGLVRVDARAEAAIAFLAQRFGDPALAQLLQQGANGTPAGFDALVQKITGQSTDSIDALLDASLQ